jgi:predicted RNase H-like HicB family nuclease/DNA-binding XRE family transcriptional regulator
MVYYCTMEKEEDMLIVQFPDMPNIMTFGYTEEEALAMAKDALDGVLECEVANHASVPPPSFGTGAEDEGFPITVAPHVALALRLRELRGEQSQAETAMRLGLGYHAYLRLENPVKPNPTLKTLERIAHAFGKELQVQIG